jgi:hypothetical protein
MSSDTIKGRLHGWFWWKEFCDRQNISALAMKELTNPAVTMANFLSYLEDRKAKESWKNDSRPAVLILFDLVLPGTNLSNNAFLKSMFRSMNTTVKRMSKYRDSWDLGIVLDYIRAATLMANLAWKDQMARAAWILMVFVPLRMTAIWRLDPSTEKKGKFGESIEVDTREKTNTKRGKMVAVIRPIEDKRLCPLYHYNMLKRGARNRGVTNTLFCTDRGKPYTTSDVVRHGVDSANKKAGINALFGPNTTRRALMNTLMKFMKEHEVNAFTGHSHNSHTVLTNYYRLDENWAGQRLALTSAAGPKVVAVSEEAQELMMADDQETDSEDNDDHHVDTNPLEPFVDQITSTKDHARTKVGGSKPNKKARKADLRAKATEVVTKGSSSKVVPIASFSEPRVPSTTLAKAASGGFCEDRKGEGRNSTARSSVSSLPTEVFTEDVRSSLGEYPAQRLLPVVCPPGSDAQAAATNRKRK